MIPELPLDMDQIKGFLAADEALALYRHALQASVDGPVLEVSFREELPETTICVLLKAGFKDYHQVQSRKNYNFCFSTTDRIDSGTITGKILFKQKPDSTGVAVLVKVSPGDTLGDLTTEEPARR